MIHKELMGMNGIASNRGISGAEALSETYRVLNEQRIEIDQRTLGLSPNDPARDMLWQELESVLIKLRDVVIQLADAPAKQLSDLRRKTDVLATLLRSDEARGGPIIPEGERTALALSITDDVARLSVE